MATSADANTADLEGRIALVTGSARRLGRSIALALAEAGCDVIVHYLRSEEAARKTAAEVEARGRRAHLIACDLSDAQATQETIRDAIRAMGGLDILVNNVGSIVWKGLSEHSPSDWKTCLDGTLFATLHASEAGLPALRESGRGRIVNILDADADATTPVPFATAYKIGKRATFTLTRTMAATEAAAGVTVNAVSPGTLDDSTKQPALERIPAGRYGRHDDVTNAVLYLAGDGACYVTGTQLVVAGGYLL